MVRALILILCIAVAVGIIWWVCDYLPVPAPMNKFVKIISMVIGMVAILLILLNIAGVAIPA